MIIGLTGPIASGKTTVAQILTKSGFEYYTYSDILRAEAKKRGIEQTRVNLQKLGTELKKDNPGILSQLIIKNAKSKHIVADGIRTVDEILELKKAPQSMVLGIVADKQVRFERLKARARPGDPKSFEEFDAIDDAENQGKNEGQNIDHCLENADHIIKNDSSLEKLEATIKEISPSE